jgi:hypothetical protein
VTLEQIAKAAAGLKVRGRDTYTLNTTPAKGDMQKMIAKANSLRTDGCVVRARRDGFKVHVSIVAK